MAQAWSVAEVLRAWLKTKPSLTALSREPLTTLASQLRGQSPRF